MLSRLSETSHSELDVLEVLPVGIFILDSSLRVVFVNETLETYFGIPRERMIGKDKRQLVSKRIKNIFEQGDNFASRLLAAYADNSYPTHFTCHVRGGRGRRERYLEHRSKPISMGPYTGGRAEVYSDITQEIESKQEQTFLQNQVMQLQEREKARIAKDLHDGLGQSSVAVKLMLEAIASSLAAKYGEADDEYHRLKKVIRHVDQMSDEIRAISFDLTPSMLNPLGLKDTLEWMKIHFSDLYQLKIELTCHGLTDRRIPPTLEIPLFRIFQESLNNIVRHAQASVVHLSLIYNHPQVIAVITDNGRGFNPATVIEGLGIRSMQNRVQQLGGTFKLQTKVGKGTTIRVEVPVGEVGFE